MHVRTNIVIEDDVQSDALLARYEMLLSPREKERERAYAFAADRKRHRVTRALVRTILSEEIPEIAPRDWEFEEGPHGRPAIHPRHGISHVSFNVSHTNGAIALVVARGATVGVDIEDCQRRGQTSEIAERFFSPAEVHALRALPPSEQRERFFVLWTLKESFIKGRGLGLSLALDSFSFTFDGPRIVFDQPGWTFATYAIGSRHLMSIGVEAPSPIDITLERTVPLEGSALLDLSPMLVGP